jgi:hypothetical protein
MGFKAYLIKVTRNGSNGFEFFPKNATQVVFFYELKMCSWDIPSFCVQSLSIAIIFIDRENIFIWLPGVENPVFFTVNSARRGNIISFGKKTFRNQIQGDKILRIKEFVK